MALFAALRRQQRRQVLRGNAPLLHPALWRTAGFRTGLLAVLALYAGVASSFFVLALYLQNGRLLTPLESGLVFSVLATAFTVTSVSAGRVSQWLGRPPLVVGALGMALGLGALWMVVRQIGAGGPLLALLPPLLIDGAGMGLVMAPLVATVLGGLPSEHPGTAAGALATTQEFGNALGLALIGLVFFGVRDRGDAAAFGASLLAGRAP